MLQTIQIKNFRNLKDIILSFEKFSSIVGENGTGKTSILEAINFAMSPNFLGTRINEQDFNNADDGQIEIVLGFDKSFTVALSDGYTTQPIPCNQIYLSVKRREKASAGKALSDPYTVTHFYVPDNSVTKTGDDKWLLKRKGGTDFRFSTLGLSKPLEISGLPKAFYFNKERTNQIDVGFNSTLQKICQEYNWRFRKSLTDETYQKDILTKWNEIYALILSGIDKEKLKSTLYPIQERLEQLTHSSFGSLELSILNVEQPFTKSFFSSRSDLNQIHHSGLGSGISMILSFIVLETISSLAKEELLILVDEPELHLHPQLQNQLFKYLKDSPNQTIVSTHSENMVEIGNWTTARRITQDQKCYPNDDVLETILIHSKGNKKIIEHLNEIKGFYQDKTIFFRENNEILFARKVLLVEGPAEKYGLKALALKHGASFDELTIISCNGKEKIKYYQLLCKAFNVPYFTLFDLDGESEKTDLNSDIILWSDNLNFAHFTKSFEECFGFGSKTPHKASKTLSAIDSVSNAPEEIKEAISKIKLFIDPPKAEKKKVETKSKAAIVTS